MKKLVCICATIACLPNFILAQVASIQMSAGDGKYVVLSAPTTLPVGTLRLDVPDEGTVIVSDGNIDEYAWVLGGNASPISNRLGTLTNTDLVFVTGASGPNTRMTLTSGGLLNVGASSQFQIDGSTGNISKIRNINYSWPGSHATGYLQNDGSGNLSWQTSVQASRAGLGTWFENNYSGGAVIMDVSGTSIKFIGSAFPGGISGVSIVCGSAGTNGTLTATVTLNGVATTLTCTVNGNAGEQFAFATPASPIPFVAGQRIGVNLNDAGFTPNNNDILITVFANF